MREQQVCLVFRFVKKIPGIVSSIIMSKNPSVEATHEYSEKHNCCSMEYGKWKNLPANNKMQDQCAENQVKQKQKVAQHRKFTCI
jgi:hypothetical protein